MKVLHILNELRFSGAEMLLATAAPHFMRDGSSHTILSTGEEVGDYAPQLRAAGFHVEHLPFGKSPLFFLRLLAFLRREKFYVVHSHAERANFWTCLVALAGAKRVVRTIHNSFSFEGRLRARRGWQRRLLKRLGVTFVACSQLVGRTEKERFGLDTAVVANWMDPNRVREITAEGRADARTRLGIASDTFVILSLANYGPAKNLEAIVAATRLCAREFDVLYLQCGAGGDDLARAVGLERGEPVRLMGAVPDIVDVVAAADAFVCTSFFEGGQISLLEVGRAGSVCVTTRVGLAEEFDGQPNVSFIEPTAESLAEALRSVRARPLAERLAAGAALRTFVIAHFSPEVGARQYMAIYSDGAWQAATTAAAQRGNT